MRRIREDIGDRYNDQVAFYIVGTDPSESLETLEADRKRLGLPWITASAEEGMLHTLQIYTQASKVAIGSDGKITHRYGIGKGDFESWADLFDDIAAN